MSELSDKELRVRSYRQGVKQYLGLDALAFLLEGSQAPLDVAPKVDGSLPFIGLPNGQQNSGPKGGLCQLLPFLSHGFLHASEHPFKLRNNMCILGFGS